MLGIDIVECKRMESVLNKKPEKIFFESELNYILKHKEKLQVAAGHFCAKEAVMKALDAKDINFLDIQICHNENGKPFCLLFNNAKQKMEKLGMTTCEISISHIKNIATAICLLNNI